MFCSTHGVVSLQDGICHDEGQWDSCRVDGEELTLQHTCLVQALEEKHEVEQRYSEVLWENLWFLLECLCNKRKPFQIRILHQLAKTKTDVIEVKTEAVRRVIQED